MANEPYICYMHMSLEISNSFLTFEQTDSLNRGRGGGASRYEAPHMGQGHVTTRGRRQRTFGPRL